MDQKKCACFVPGADWEENLLCASELGHSQCVDKLCDQITCIGEGLKSLNKALHRAARHGQCNTVRALLKIGSEVNCALRHGKSALMLAAEQGFTQTVQVLVEAGAHIEKCDGILLLSALNRAVLCGHTETVQVLLQSGASPDSRHVGTGKTSLILAAEKGYTEIIQLLLHRQTDIHAQDIKGWNALFWATFSGHTKSIQIMMEAGLNVNSLDDSGQDRPLLVAIKNNNTKVVCFLLLHGAQVNCGNSSGCTPLMHSVLNNNIVLVEILLKRGSCVNQADAQGMTALHHSARVASESPDPNSLLIPTMLLMSGADVRIKDINRNSALDTAIGSLVRFDAYDGDNQGSKSKTLFFYAVGASIQQCFIDCTDRNRDVISQIILDDQQPLLTLTGLCRRYIRAYLLRSSGANHNNLIIPVPQLPLPRKLKDFLLFYLDTEACQG